MNPVLTGIDVLVRDGFKQLRGKRIGLITNHTGKSRDGIATIDLLHKAPGVTLVSLFSPEHGIRGVLDADVPAEKDEKTGLPIHSLFYKGGTGRPLEGSLNGIDTLVIDLQDIGARIYTYQLAMGYAMEEAAKRKIAVVDTRPSESDQRLADRRATESRARGRRVAEHVHLLSADADSSWHDDGRVGEAV